MLRPAPFAALLAGALALFAAPSEAAGPSKWTVGTFTLPVERRPALERPRSPLHEHFMDAPCQAPAEPVVLDELEDGEDRSCARRPHRRQDDPRKPVRRYPRPDRPGARPRPPTSRKTGPRRRPRALTAWLAAIEPPAVTPRVLPDERPTRPP